MNTSLFLEIFSLGYERRDKQSTMARKFLKYYAAKNKVHVQHVENGGEASYRNYKLDGFVKRAPPQRDLCIEVQGYGKGNIV